MSSAPMQSVDWFPKPGGPKAGHDLLSSALKAAVGIGVGALFYWRGHVVLGGVAAGLAILFFVASLAPAGRALLAKVFGVVGEWAGRIVGSVLLTAIFVLVLTPARFVRRLSGVDELHMHGRNKERSFWLPCDPEEHKRKYAGAMFATEAQLDTGGSRAIVWLVALVALLVGAEVTLRIQGYGRPLMYLSDPRVGYILAPGQDTSWRGAHLATNAEGMRAPARAATKSKGALRILEIGTDGGLRVDQANLYARGIEKKLAEKGGGRAVEVWNVDVEGWGTPSVRGFVDTFGTFEADVAVITLTPDALARPLQSLLSMRFVSAAKPAKLALEEKLLDILWRYRADRTVIDEAHLSASRALGVAAAGKLALALKDKGVEALFVVVWPRGSSPPDQVKAISELRVAAEKAGARVHEIAGAAVDPESASLTTEGHAALADAIATELANESAKVRGWIGGSAP